MKMYSSSHINGTSTKADLAEVVQKHTVNIHVFADNMQLYRPSDEMSATVVQLE